jgi:hypothetical protein
LSELENVPLWKRFPPTKIDEEPVQLLREKLLMVIVQLNCPDVVPSRYVLVPKPFPVAEPDRSLPLG